MKRNILLCVAGLTPQIITESLYVLAVQHNVLFDEIRVITSSIGKKLVKERVFDSGVWQSFCVDYQQQTARIRFDLDCLDILKDADGNELPDIRTTEENKLAANQICEIVRQLTDQKDTTIYASVAGGRKTMGNYLGFAMSLFAHTNDTLSHVLVDEEFERPRKKALNFYYEPPDSRQVFDIEDNAAFTKDEKPLMTDMAKTTLAEIPFVKLRRILPEDYGEQPTDYAVFVDKVQNELDALENEPKLEIYLRERLLKVGKLKAKLSIKQFLIYVLFAKHRKQASSDDESAISHGDLKASDFNEIIREISDNDFDLKYLVEESEAGFTENDYKILIKYFKVTDGKLLFNHQAGNINTYLTQGLTKLKDKLETANFPPKYFVTEQHREKNVTYNWIAIEANKIEFIQTEKIDIHFNQFGRIS